jgi:hypothetical protein
VQAVRRLWRSLGTGRAPIRWLPCLFMSSPSIRFSLKECERSWSMAMQREGKWGRGFTGFGWGIDYPRNLTRREPFNFVVSTRAHPSATEWINSLRQCLVLVVIARPPFASCSKRCERCERSWSAMSRASIVGWSTTIAAQWQLERVQQRAPHTTTPI